MKKPRVRRWSRASRLHARYGMEAPTGVASTVHEGKNCKTLVCGMASSSAIPGPHDRDRACEKIRSARRGDAARKETKGQRRRPAAAVADAPSPWRGRRSVV